MKEKFVNWSIKRLNQKHQYTDLENKKFKYSLQIIYSTVTKVFVIMTISFLLGTIKETLWLMLFYSVLRGFAYGIHAKSNAICWIVSLTTYGIIPLMMKYIVFTLWQIIIIEIICFILLLLFAPADTPKKPMIHESNRRNNKFLCIFVTFIYVISIFFIKKTIIQNAIIFSLIIESVCVCPLTYKIFKIPYNNYKTYVKPTKV